MMNRYLRHGHQRDCQLVEVLHGYHRISFRGTFSNSGCLQLIFNGVSKATKSQEIVARFVLTEGLCGGFSTSQSGEVNRYPCYKRFYGRNHRESYRHHARRLWRQTGHRRPPDSGPERYYLHEAHGLSPGEMVDHNPSMTLADVYAPLVYARDHREDIRRDIIETQRS
jgi:hypothetical protein